MVSAVASADSLDMRTFAGLRSVSPSNSDYVGALEQLLRDPGLRTGIIVADQSDDLTVKSLWDAYNSKLRRYLKYPALPFVGGTIGNPARPGVFSPVMTNVCNAADPDKGLDMIFYAGRTADFNAFAEALSTRICQKSPLVVFAVGTGFQVSQRLVEALSSSKVTVVYASGTDPEWINDPANRPKGFTMFLDIARSDFGAESLTDGFAIMYHDAVVCAVRALHLAVEADGSPSPIGVKIQFDNLRYTVNSVEAASGTLAFHSEGDGRASGKAVVIRQIGWPDPRLPHDLPTLYT
jgi:hypothetical protein